MKEISEENLIIKIDAGKFKKLKSIFFVILSTFIYILFIFKLIIDLNPEIGSNNSFLLTFVLTLLYFFFGLIFPISFIISSVILNKEGFFKKTFFTSKFYKWKEVKNFSILEKGEFKDLIFFEVLHNSKHDKIKKLIFNGDVLPWSKKEQRYYLLELFKDYKEKYGK